MRRPWVHPSSTRYHERDREREIEGEEERERRVEIEEEGKGRGKGRGSTRRLVQASCKEYRTQTLVFVCE